MHFEVSKIVPRSRTFHSRCQCRSVDKRRSRMHRRIPTRPEERADRNLLSAILRSRLGIKGESKAKDKTKEFYALRLPLGIQFEFRQLNLQIFGEATGYLGDLPQTNLSAAGRVGLRARF